VASKYLIYHEKILFLLIADAVILTPRNAKFNVTITR